jgi:hypothetical protein
MDNVVSETWTTCAKLSLANSASYDVFIAELSAHYATVEDFQSVRDQILDHVIAGYGTVNDKKYGQINVMDDVNEYLNMVSEREKYRAEQGHHGLQSDKNARYRRLMCINKKYIGKSTYLVNKISKMLFPPIDIEFYAEVEVDAEVFISETLLVTGTEEVLNMEEFLPETLLVTGTVEGLDGMSGTLLVTGTVEVLNVELPGTVDTISEILEANMQWANMPGIED